MSDRRQQPQLGPANGSVSGIDPAVVHALLTEIRSLSRQLQHASSAQPNGVHDDRLQRSVDVLLGHLDRLPDRIADALGEALARQHRTIMTDVRASLADLAARLTPASEDNSR